MNDEEIKAELRQIEKSIEREERIEVLKAKHLIVGTREEQKVLVLEKKQEVETRLAEAQELSNENEE